HWNGADQSHNFRRRCEGKTRAHNRIAGTDAFSHEDQEQCVSAACASDGVCNATEASELALEQAYFGTEDKLAMPHNSSNGVIDQAADRAPWGRQVNEGYGSRRYSGMLVHHRCNSLSAGQPPGNGAASREHRVRGALETSDRNFQTRHRLFPRD